MTRDHDAAAPFTDESKGLVTTGILMILVALVAWRTPLAATVGATAILCGALAAFAATFRALATAVIIAGFAIAMIELAVRARTGVPIAAIATYAIGMALVGLGAALPARENA